MAGAGLGDRARRVAAGMLLTLLVGLASGCAVLQPRDDSGSGDGPLGFLFPRPLGSVSMEEEPIACTFGWVGVGAGTLVGLAAGSLGEGGDGRVVGAGLAVGILGGIGMTLVGHSLQFLWDLVAGDGEEGRSTPAPSVDYPP